MAEDNKRKRTLVKVGEKNAARSESSKPVTITSFGTAILF
jgi:hypothetical protein